MSGSMHIRPVQEPILSVPRSTSTHTGSSLKELNSAWESVDRAKHALERAEARLHEAEGPYGILTPMDTTTMTDRSDTRVPVDRVPTWKLHSPPPLQNTVADRYSGRNKNKRVTIQEDSTTCVRDRLKLGLSNGYYRSPHTSPSGSRSPVGERSFLHQNNSGTTGQSFTTIETPTKMHYLNEPVPPHSVGYTSAYDKLYGPRKRDFHVQNGSLGKLRSRIEEQKQEILNGSRTKDYIAPRRYHQDQDPVLTSDNLNYDWPKNETTRLTVRKVAAAPPAPVYKGFSSAETRYALPDGRIVSGRHDSVRNRSPDRKRAIKTTRTSEIKNKGNVEKHRKVNEMESDIYRKTVAGAPAIMVRKRAHNPNKPNKKTVRKVHQFKGDKKPLNPEKHGTVSVNAWRNSHKTAIKVLGPAPKLRKVSDPQPALDPKKEYPQTQYTKKDQDIEDANISDHPIESDDDKDRLSNPDGASHLPADAKGVLNDLHLESDEEENSKSNDAIKHTSPSYSQKARKCRKSKTSQNKPINHYDVPKVRSYDSNEVRRYMAKQKAERKKREKEEKEQKNLAEKKKQEQLDALFRKQQESCKSKVVSGRVLQPRLDQTFLKETKPSHTQIVAEMSGSDKENKQAWSPSSSSDTQPSFSGLKRLDLLGIVTSDDTKPSEQPLIINSHPSSFSFFSQAKYPASSKAMDVPASGPGTTYTHNERSKPTSRSMRIESLRATAAALQGRLENETRRFTSQWSSADNNENSSRWAYPTGVTTRPVNTSIASTVGSTTEYKPHFASPVQDWRAKTKPVMGASTASRKLDFDDGISHRTMYKDWAPASTYSYTSALQSDGKSQFAETSDNDWRTRHEKIVGEGYRSEFSGDLPGMSNLTTGARKAEQFSLQTDAATRIQAVYRGHSVRQKLGSWLSHDKELEDFNDDDIGIDDEEDDEPSEYQDLPSAKVYRSEFLGRENSKDKSPSQLHRDYRSWRDHHSGNGTPVSKETGLYTGTQSPSDGQYHTYTSRPRTLGHSSLKIPDDGHSVIDIYTRHLQALRQDNHLAYLSHKSPVYDEDFKKLPLKSPVYEDDFTNESLSHISHSLKREKSGSAGLPVSKGSPGTRTDSQISDLFSSSISTGPKPTSVVSDAAPSYTSPTPSSGLDKSLEGKRSDEDYRTPRSSKGSPASTLSRTSKSSPHSSAGSSPRLPDQYIDPVTVERPQPSGQAGKDSQIPNTQPVDVSDYSQQSKSVSSTANIKKSDPVQSLLMGETNSKKGMSHPVINQAAPSSYQPGVTQADLPNRPREHQFDRWYPSTLPSSQRYFSPSALEIKMAAELNRLDSVDESVRKLTEFEQTRAISLAQQESVSIAQILKARQQGHERELHILSTKARQEVDDAHRQLEQLKQQARETALTAEKTLAQTRKDATDAIQQSTNQVLKSQAEAAKATAEAAKQLAEARHATLDHSIHLRDYDMGQMASQTASAAAAAAVNAAMEHQRSHQEMWMDHIKSTIPEAKSATRSPTSESSRHKMSSDYSDDFTSFASDKEPHKSSKASAADAVKSNSSGDISEDLLTIKNASSSIATEPGVDAHASTKSRSIVEEIPESYSEDFDRTISEVDTLDEDRSDNSKEEIISEKPEKEIVASEDKRKSPPTTKQSPDRESLNRLSTKLLSQQLKDEEFRAQQQLDLLRLREKAIKEKTRAEMAWLEHQKKKHTENQDEEGITSVKKKQRSLNSRLQTELSEIKRLQKAQEIAQKDRQLLFYQQQEILRIRQSTEEFKGRMGDISFSSVSEISSNEGLVDDASNIAIDTSIGLEFTGLSNTGGENEDREVAAHKQAKVLQKLKLMQAPLNSRHLMKRQQKLSRRRKTAEELLAWKQKLDEEEAKVVKMEKQALNLLDGNAIGSNKSKKEKTPQESKLTDPLSRSLSRESDTTIGEVVEEEDKAGESSIAEEISQASSIVEDVVTDRGTSKQSGTMSSVPSEMSIDDALYHSSMADYSHDQFDTASADTSVTSTKPNSTRKGVIKSPIGSLISLESLRSPVAPWKRRESESGSESERSFSQTMSETASDQSDVEGRLRALNDQLKRRKSEAERLRKQQKRMYREKLKVQEASLRKQLEAYEKFIEKTKKELSADAELAKGAVKPQIKQPGHGKDRALPGLTRQRTKSESSRESLPLDSTPVRHGRESESSHSSLEEDHSPNPPATPSPTTSNKGLGLTFTPSPKQDEYVINKKSEHLPSGILQKYEDRDKPVEKELILTPEKTAENIIVRNNEESDTEINEEIDENISEAISSQASDNAVISTGVEKDEAQKSLARKDNFNDEVESLLSENEGLDMNISVLSESHKSLSVDSSNHISAASYKIPSIGSNKIADYSVDFESEVKAASTEEDISEHLSFSSDIVDEQPEFPKEIIISPNDDQPKVVTTERLSQSEDRRPVRQSSASESETSFAEEVQSEASEATVTEDQPRDEVYTPVVDKLEPSAKGPSDSGILEEAELSRADTTESNSRLDNPQDNTEDESSIAEEFSGPITDDAALDMIIRSAASAVESFNFGDEEESEDDIFSQKNVSNVDDTPRAVEDIPRDDDVVVATGGLETVVEKITDNFTKSLVDSSKEKIADVLNYENEKYEDEENEGHKFDVFSEAKEEFEEEMELELEKTADQKSEILMQNLIGDAIGTMIAIRRKRDNKLIEHSVSEFLKKDVIIDKSVEAANQIDVKADELPKEEEEIEQLENQGTQIKKDHLEKGDLNVLEQEDSEEHTNNKEPVKDEVSSIIALPPLSPTKSLTSDHKDVDHDVFAPPDSPKIDDSRSSSPDISDRMEQMQLLDQQLMDRDIFGEQEWFDDDFSSMPKTKSLVEVPKRNKDDQKKQEPSSTIELSKLKEIQKITEELFFAVPHNKDDVGKMVSKSLDELIQRRALNESLDNATPSATLLGDDTKDSDIESVSKKSYKTLVFDLSNEVYKDVLSEQKSVEHPPWIKQKRRPRKYIIDKGSTKDEDWADMIHDHVGLLLGLKKKKKSETFSLKYSKKKKDHVDEILIQELREEEPEWVNYDDDEVTVKMQLADGIMESLLTETAMVLTHINDKRKLREQQS
ncbi:centrosome-associated protein 350-like [Anneissia japonica]|uniref:centrosome-associated protein 350-like n=1 Tax=Anneissia japonica TaxID=1529436 RepID=UPI0014259001|nr:centrosome-associated protein 350-like [Anneissia japonica]